MLLYIVMYICFNITRIVPKSNIFSHMQIYFMTDMEQFVAIHFIIKYFYFV